ncbi:MAG: transcriptional repressor [Eubacterium sp.]|nr:transcriptional repressor [Eubacterium sp.]
MPKEYRSKYRNWITEYFKEHADLKISASGLYAEMETSGLSANLTTVYRNLDRLTAEKVLSMHKVPGEDEKFYQYMRPQMGCTNHLHLLCSGCGKIFHLNCGFMEEINSHLMADHGFTLDCEESMLVGLCGDCRKKSKN